VRAAIAASLQPARLLIPAPPRVRSRGCRYQPYQACGIPYVCGDAKDVSERHRGARCGVVKRIHAQAPVLLKTEDELVTSAEACRGKQVRRDRVVCGRCDEAEPLRPCRHALACVCARACRPMRR
jgi:hypothetical protein